MAKSTAVQDYLKAIYDLSGEEHAAATSAIAERLQIAAGSVTGMLKRLAEQGLVEHVPYYGTRLTPSGETEAIGVIRRHRILELFLVQVLGYTWDRVHAEAERLEHAVTDELIDRMAAALGEPTRDPHGAPIPSVGVAFEDPRLPVLADLEPGERAVLRRVPDEDSDTLRYLADLGLVPGAPIELVDRAPLNGPLRLRIRGNEHFVACDLARSLQVEPGVHDEEGSGVVGS
jgi:DtxR family transcriptional regulator, Mn-dependent transcriptional regulator